VRTARAKGLSSRLVLMRHALRNAVLPVVTIIGLQIGLLLGGAVLTEKVFSWQGMGDMLIDGVNARDINVVLAWLMVTAVIVVLFNLAADIIYAVLDPRIRYD
jgi:peptide/nickel transport system permease protein